MIEQWRDVKGYEGFYQVSNLGRFKSLARRVNAGSNANHKYQTIPERILHTYRANYTQVRLSRDGKTKCYFVHRLVAGAFIPNPDNLPCVNHKDENRYNNCADNLEWCTYKYNNEYNGRVEKCRGKISNTLKGRKHKKQLTNEQREHIRQGAINGWETRRRHKSAILSDEIKEAE